MKSTRIKVREVRPQDIKEIFKHMSVQSILGIKSLYGRVVQDDIINMLIASERSICVLYGARQVALVFFVRTNQNSCNMFLLFTSRMLKCYNDVQEQLLSEMSCIDCSELNTLVYEGSNTEQRYMEDLGFEQTESLFVSLEGKKHLMYRKQIK